MRTRLLALLLTLIAAVLLALGLPLAASRAGSEQQRLVRDRVDDTARLASDAQLSIVSDTTIVSPHDPSPGPDLVMLQHELERYEQVYGITAGVFDRDGRPLAVSHPGFDRPDRHTARAAFADALAGRRSGDPPQVWPWQRDRIAVAAPVIHRGDVVAVALTDSPTGRMRSRVLRTWAFFGAAEAVALLAALLLATRLTGWVLRPVRTLDRVTHEIATGQLGARVAHTHGPPELRRLARSFNEMADHVQDVVDQQRAFAADASHQLRNPLAALMLRIEELGLTLPPQDATAVDDLRDEARRLTRVLDELLELALAENATTEQRLTDVAALVDARLTAWLAAARTEGRHFVRHGPTALTGMVDPVGLGSALDAVLDNALKFGPPGQPVDVEVTADGSRLLIHVADRGPGLIGDELRRIGDRFWRSPRHQNTDGSGLGLSIARTLLHTGGGTLHFAPRTGGGLVVSLAVPREG